MSDYELLGGMDGPPEKEPPPTATVKQSILVIAIALALGTGAVLLLQIHYLASEVGVLVWLAVTFGPSFFVANQAYKMMVGFHTWARLTVGTIIFFSVALFITFALEAHHLGHPAAGDDE
jgi:hypothetical protein